MNIFELAGSFGLIHLLKQDYFVQMAVSVSRIILGHGVTYQLNLALGLVKILFIGK